MRTAASWPFRFVFARSSLSLLFCVSLLLMEPITTSDHPVLFCAVCLAAPFHLVRTLLESVTAPPVTPCPLSGRLAQAEMAKMTAAFRSARVYLHDEIDQTWEVAQTSEDIPVDRRAALRMACTHMVRTGAEIARNCYDLGGGAALFQSSDLQRRFRDAHAMTQHIVTAPGTWELTGRLLFGLPTDAGMV